MHAPTDIFGKDDAHPIPDIDVCDIHAEGKDGGHDLFIVIAAPLQADERSQRRLLEKIARYLGFLSGIDEVPRGACKRIIVKIHGASAPVIFDLLERSRPWVDDNRATLEISKIP